jgi:hypothetical protein
MRLQLPLDDFPDQSRHRRSFLGSEDAKAPNQVIR